ncbi:MAG: hypothetical protein CM1200mP12_08690 [Gammaproteobacteria bacterium]|nr:MAG: hypothetical protein CM1200mP12_08690 [Gammaproteobacteria bacterium]
MAYGAYMPANQKIGSTALSVAFLDTLVAILAGIAIFPIVFAIIWKQLPDLVSFCNLTLGLREHPLGLILENSSLFC